MSDNYFACVTLKNTMIKNYLLFYCWNFPNGCNSTEYNTFCVCASSVYNQHAKRMLIIMISYFRVRLYQSFSLYLTKDVIAFKLRFSISSKNSFEKVSFPNKNPAINLKYTFVSK